MNSEEMTPEEKQAKIDRFKFIINHPKFKGDKRMLQSEINKLEGKIFVGNIPPGPERDKRLKELQAGQRKRYNEKYANYELSWGGRYSNYECLLRIDPFLFD
jgi:hypothetical protein